MDILLRIQELHIIFQKSIMLMQDVLVVIQTQNRFDIISTKRKSGVIIDKFIKLNLGKTVNVKQIKCRI